MSPGEWIGLAGLIVSTGLALGKWMSTSLDSRFDDLRGDLDRRFKNAHDDTNRIERKVDRINGTVARHENQIQLLMYRAGVEDGTK